MTGQSPNHWTTREFPVSLFFFLDFFYVDHVALQGPGWTQLPFRGGENTVGCKEMQQIP